MNNKMNKISHFLLLGIAIVLLIATSFYSYLLFHTLSELFCIIISVTIFLLVWNNRNQIDNQFLFIIGITSIFIAIIDILHVLSFKGMPIFFDYDANLPTQLWIVSRYMNSITLVVALFFYEKKPSAIFLFLTYFIITIIMVTLIFMRIFPECYNIKTGLTLFKKISEYIIISLILLSTIGLFLKRKKYDKTLIRYFIAANIVSIFAELTFTTYFNVYGTSNLIGHVLKVTSYGLWYLVVIEAGIARPSEIFYRKLRESEEKYRLLYSSMDQGLAFHEIITDEEGKPIDYIFLDINDSYTRLLGITREMAIGKRIKEIMPNVEQYWIDIFGKVALTGESSYYENFLETTGKYYSTYSYSPKKNYFAVLVTDISERKNAEIKINTLFSEKELLLKEVHHRIKNNMNTITSLLNLQADSSNETSIKDALNDAGSRVKSMQLLYEKLYQSVDFTELSVLDYFTSLIDEITSNFSQFKSITIVKEIDNFILNVRQLQPLGIIINELLTNIMKYAFEGRTEGKIIFSTTIQENLVTLTLADNGNGMPESVSFEHSTGFGLVLVNSLTEQLGGTIRIERGQGTKIVLEFEK